jgi:uncharacterized membrane protein YcaP (DUF421 family)
MRVEFVKSVFTAEGKDLDALGVAFRTLIIFFSAVIIVKIGKKRFLGQNTSLDILVGVMLGSMLSRAINGSGKVLSTVVAGLVIVAIHFVLSWLSMKSNKFRDWVKGVPEPLVEGGQMVKKNLLAHDISEDELISGLRLQARTGNIEDVEESYLERNGMISGVPKQPRPQIVEITVEKGVQTVRLKLG